MAGRKRSKLPQPVSVVRFAVFPQMINMEFCDKLPSKLHTRDELYAGCMPAISYGGWLSSRRGVRDSVGGPAWSPLGMTSCFPTVWTRENNYHSAPDILDLRKTPDARKEVSGLQTVR